ncbi:MAG: 4-demethylwyosine synthase TYW1 [Candidatus Micrarchaeota archaeon]
MVKLYSEDYCRVGSHAAVKPCLYAKHALLDKGMCYKNEFYGIQSHRCVQMTPAQDFCNQSCVFCWREIGLHNPVWKGKADSPEEIVDGCIAGQKKQLMGFKGNERVDKTRFAEAMEPKHAAISLDGEPTLYPHLPVLIKEFHKRKISTFLVSNGTRPKMLKRLKREKALPTQLYLSLAAPDEATYKKFIGPLLPEGWALFNESLSFFASLGTRSVLRMTLAKGVNMSKPEEYAKLIATSGADYVEVKGYSAIGRSRQRLGLAYAPSHDEVKAFGQQIAEENEYLYTAEHVPSRIILLSRDEQTAEKRKIDFELLF